MKEKTGIGPIGTIGPMEPLICIIHQTNYLLDQQLRQLEQAFLKEGGFTERLYQTRSRNRKQ